MVGTGYTVLSMFSAEPYFNGVDKSFIALEKHSFGQKRF